jgi:hypothetical protein
MRTDRQYQDALDQDEQEDRESSLGSEAASPAKGPSGERESTVQQQDVRIANVPHNAKNKVQQQDVRISPMTTLDKREVQQRDVKYSTITTASMFPGHYEVPDIAQYLKKPMSEDCALLIEWASEFYSCASDDGGDEKQLGWTKGGSSSATTIDSIREA